MEISKNNFVKQYKSSYENGVHMTTANDTIPPCTPAMMDLELSMFDHDLNGGRAAALFMDGKLVINNCGLDVETNDKA